MHLLKYVRNYACLYLCMYTVFTCDKEQGEVTDDGLGPLYCNGKEDLLCLCIPPKLFCSDDENDLCLHSLTES